GPLDLVRRRLPGRRARLGHAAGPGRAGRRLFPDRVLVSYVPVVYRDGHYLALDAAAPGRHQRPAHTGGLAAHRVRMADQPRADRPVELAGRANAAWPSA